MKKSIYILTFLVCLTLIKSVLAQSFTPEEQKQLDSLNAIINNPASHDTSLANAYVGLSDILFVSNLDTMIPLCTKAKNIAEKNLAINQSRSITRALRKALATALNNIGFVFNNQGQMEKSVEYYHKSLKIQKEIGDKHGEASSLNNIGSVYHSRGQMENTLIYYLKSLKIYEEIGDKQGIANSLNNIGSAYDNQGQIENALEYHHKSLKIREEIDDKQGIAYSLNSIGFLYNNLGQIENALKYYHKSLKIYEEIGSKKGIAYGLNNIGGVYYNQGQIENALEYYHKSLKIFENTEDKKGIATSLNNIGYIYRDQEQIENAIKYYHKSLKIREEIGDKQGIANSLNNIGGIYLKQNQIPKALEYAKKSLMVSKELGYPANISSAAKLLFEVYEKQGKGMEALEMHKLYVNMRDSINNEETQKVSARQQAKYEYEKQKAIDDAEHEKLIAIEQEEKQKQKIITYATGGGLALVVLFLVFVFNRLQVTRRQKGIIEEKEKETQIQKTIIEEKHKEITDSINYAERIQRSFLATTEMLDKYLGVTSSSPSSAVIASEERTKQSIQKDEVASLPTVVRNDEGSTSMDVTSSSPKYEGVSRSERNYFVFFRPKDVVSGDFYWAAELNNGNFAFSVADSTGHGVPGAIMSILNISSLEKSIETQTEPHHILSETRRIIIDRLKKDGSQEGGKDGMDCSLLVINKDRTQLSFAAANNPVFIVRSTVIASEERTKQSAKEDEIASLPTVVRNDGNVVTSSSPKNEGISRSNTMQLIEFKPDKMPVGKHDNDTEPFNLHTATLQNGDVIYALTDGFPDQFGGEKGKKFMIKNLKELLLQIAHLPMHQQEQKLAEEFEKWKGSNEQVDDVCIIGIRVKNKLS